MGPHNASTVSFHIYIFTTAQQSPIFHHNDPLCNHSILSQKKLLYYVITLHHCIIRVPFCSLPLPCYITVSNFALLILPLYDITVTSLINPLTYCYTTLPWYDITEIYCVITIPAVTLTDSAM